MESLEEKNDERIMNMDAKVIGVEQSCRMLECKVTREVNVTEKPTNVTPINVQDWQKVQNGRRERKLEEKVSLVKTSNKFALLDNSREY